MVNDVAQLMLDNGLYASAVNRAYYAVFYAANALLATKRLARSKNSGVMSAFREHFTTLLQPHEQAAIDSFLARLYEDHGYALRVPITTKLCGSDYYIVN
ncbi:MAG: HEPN domain-containing protein [Chloroflexi bacterium]|nr:HEPN domain-containing protein [Chloroflexota bacterium]